MNFALRKVLGSLLRKNFSIRCTACGKCKKRHTSPNGMQLHTTSYWQGWLDGRDPKQSELSKQLAVKHEEVFEDVMKKSKERDKKVFQKAVELYIEKYGVYRRGHVEFLDVALSKLKEFNVHKDLEVYKQLIQIFPEGKMVPTSSWQVDLLHYPKQQECAMEIMEQMTFYGICPDDEFGYLLAKRFGTKTHTFRKYRRMMYWMPKFKHANPYQVPLQLPDNRIELAKIALRKMSVDVKSKISVYQAAELQDNDVDDTFIVSSQCSEQVGLIEEQPEGSSLSVTGPFRVWMREVNLQYFVLRAEQTTQHRTYHEYMENESNKEPKDLFQWSTIFEEEQPQNLVKPPSRHEQEDGTILAMCITGSGSKDSLVAWIRFLETECPRIAEIPVVFSLASPDTQLTVMEERVNKDQISLAQPPVKWYKRF